MKKKISKITFIILLIVLVLTIFYLKNKIQPLIIKLFGYSILTIDSGSMMPELKVGDAIIIKEYKNYNVGDIITYRIDNKYLVTHRIIEKTEKGYITKGDYNNVKDNEIIEASRIEGKVIFHATWLGFAIRYHIAFIFLIIALLAIIV